MLLWPGGGVAFVEWKTDAGRLQLNQIEWIARLTDMGFPAIVGRDPEQVLEWLETLGAPFLVRRRAA